MTVMACRYCGSGVAAGARKCPQCGGVRPARTTSNLFGNLAAICFGLLLVVIVVTLLGSWIFG